MNPIEFKEQNIIITKDQPEYMPLPAHVDENGNVVTCWKLSPDEIEKISKTGELWLSVMTFKQPLQPLFLSVDKLVISDSDEVFETTNKVRDLEVVGVEDVK
jgi:hypothetical protein